jgi:tetratricopeptide (TPR) repeat protein
MGRAYDAEADDARAERLYLRALAIGAGGTLAERPVVVEALLDLGNIYLRAGRLDEAEPLLRRYAELREEDPGPDSAAFGRGMIALARLRHLRGGYADAARLYERAFGILVPALLPDDPLLGLYLHNYGVALAGLGETARAARCYERAIEILERHPAAYTELLERARKNRARLPRESRDPEEARCLDRLPGSSLASE